jgi:hypothetical protein
MSYINADDVLPPELLREVQRFVQGSLVYIPRSGTGRLGWGARSGAREELDRRNDAIRSAKSNGSSVDQLADDYGLSTDAIRKILYGRADRL